MNWSKILLLSSLLIMGLLAGGDEEYMLLISEGNNNFDSGQLDEAVLCYKKAIKLKPGSPDAYLQLGHIHLARKYYDVAIQNFKKAEEYMTDFIYPEQEVKLYMNMAAAYHKIKFIDEERKYLYRILKISTNNSDGFYREYAGRSWFILGLLANSNNNIFSSIENFQKAIEYEYRVKACYLIIAHYYCVHNQERIDTDQEKFYSENVARMKIDLRDIYRERYRRSMPREVKNSVKSKMNDLKKLKRELDSYKWYQFKGAEKEEKEEQISRLQYDIQLTISNKLENMISQAVMKEIAAFNEKHLKEQNKERYFNYYYTKYMEAKSDTDEELFLSDSRRQAMIRDIESCALRMSAEKQSEIDRRLKEIEDEER